MNHNAIKEAIRSKQENNKPVILEFGPGENKAHPDAIGIDRIKKNSVDFVINLEDGLPFLDDNSIDTIYSHHFLEHLDDIATFMGEINRVLKAGGKKIGTVPHFSNPYFYNDYTHKNHWGIFTLCYFSNDSYFNVQIPTYYNPIDFKINQIKLHFYSPTRYRVRNFIKHLYTKLFNSNRWLLEFYEENLTYLIPAYEISFEIEKKANKTPGHD
jgi:ubiquinone/menaquinone biosynthesis C-methylase UbiE